MIGFTVLGLSLLLLGVNAQGRASLRAYEDDDLAYEKPTTPVPILKQIDRHNDDGSYTYGFESADGSFKIETKDSQGEIKGKYGYTDADGKLHVVEYGANKYGFMPQGEGITVPPVNYNEEPEPEQEQIQEYIPRPQKQPKRPRPAAPVAYAAPWQQEPIEVAPPAPQVYARPAPRVQNTPPHLLYNAEPAPVPRRVKPAFFAGAQPVPNQEPLGISYAEEPVQPRLQPAPAKAQNLRYTSSPVPARTEVKYLQPEAAPSPAHFIPSPQFSQAIQFSDPQSPQPARAFKPVQIFRPEPARAQLSRFAEPETYEEPEPARPAYLPRAAPPKARTGGFLDQLREQYALPKESGHAISDISFGFY